MIEGKTVLALIPARGGSKGLPRKNLRMLAGKPMIAWTIEEAKKSRHIDRLVLSSDDQEIIATAAAYGCEAPFIRPAELARDESSGMAPVLHALEELPGYDIILLLQPTSPLRTVQDIDDCLAFFHHNQAKACVSVTKVEKNPMWMFTLDKDSEMAPFLARGEMAARRQDLPGVYAPNGALYVADTGFIQEHQAFFTKHTLGYVMPKERSFDIDDIVDLKICECMLDPGCNPSIAGVGPR